ncbi:parathyroid hormone-related protein-like [Hippocampus zosterae]|uniref:parathyroid hormone-related protein-like n=1 Tax=Hippocampus zosterae TaxID=109293 RepID=UPI00223E1CDF|nr:parathyroid hormone-related protein-like [Hippocampus zosterae]XP_051916615.1 parathyroid hormone-related protein-like [Hippocampus zosterae]
MRSAVLLRHWSLAVFLLCSPVAPYGRTADALGGRMRRSVSHAQLMHDKGRSMQELKRRLWLQELLEEVHTAEERPVTGGGGGGGGASPDFSGNDLRQKPPEATKDLPHRLGPEREGPVLPQETHKASAYKDQPLKVATKRKKKARLGRRREGDRKRRRSRAVPTPD